MAVTHQMLERLHHALRCALLCLSSPMCAPAMFFTAALERDLFVFTSFDAL